MIARCYEKGPRQARQPFPCGFKFARFSIALMMFTGLGPKDALALPRILREIGYDERTIADALGQKTTAMARHYADGADLTRKMRGVVKNFDAELARRGDGK